MHLSVRTVRSRLLIWLALYGLLSSMSYAEQISDQISPEASHINPAAQKIDRKDPAPSVAIAKEFIVVSAHPLATQAGYQILEQGGSAIDAMVTVQTVLGLVEPQSSGLGGGSFALYYHAATNQLYTFDGRETAPLAATTDLFMADEPIPMAFFEAVIGGRSVGTPGTVKLLSELHQRFGTLDWAKLLQPAIRHAKRGFTVSPRLAYLIQRDASRLSQIPATAAYFLPNGKALKAGDILKNSDYAHTLSILAKHGGETFYRSDISQAIIDAVQTAKNKGFLTQADFDQYRIITRPNDCFAYLSYEVCSMGAPSSGSMAIQHILQITLNAGLAERKADDPISSQLIAEASRRAFADRNQYIADPDFVSIPHGLSDSEYLQKRSLDITPGKASRHIEAGTPVGFNKEAVSGKSPEQESTTHFVIVDRQGNILSMTSSIENAFGARLMVKGFLLNNELTDFSFLPKKNGSWLANRVEPGKRPRSSMSPSIVFHQTPTQDNSKQAYLALGSPGGSRIINFVAQSLIDVLLWKEGLQEAFDRPHILNRFGKMELEANTPAQELAETFGKMGYETSIQDINSGLHGVMFTPEGMIGAADKRREGLVLGK